MITVHLLTIILILNKEITTAYTKIIQTVLIIIINIVNKEITTAYTKIIQILLIIIINILTFKDQEHIDHNAKRV